MYFNLIKKLVYSSWYEPSKVLISTQILKKSILLLTIQISRYHRFPITTKHSISFATACLPISEYSNIIALRASINEWFDIVLEYFALGGCTIENFLQLLFATACRHLYFDTFLYVIQLCTLSIQAMDYLYYNYDGNNGRMRTMVTMLTLVGCTEV